MVGGVFHDHSRRDSGYINAVQALERSSNTFFYQLGVDLGVDTMAKYGMAFGFGRRTGVPLRREITGLVPTSEWKEKRYGVPWQTGESVVTAIGQGPVLTTSIQLAVGYSAIANEGKIYKPQLVKKMVNNDLGIFQSFEPEIYSDLTDPAVEGYIENKHFKTVKKGLWAVVNGKKGTARSLKIPGPFKIAGKTGTPQVRRFSEDEIYKDCEKRPRKFRHHGVFVGFAPAASPEITIAVFTEHSCKSSHALPIAKDVFLAYLKKYKNLQIESKDDKSKPES